MRHTLSNLGLRLLLATAKQQNDTFWLKYTRLRGAVGDEAWRTKSAGTDYIVRSEAGKLRCARTTPKRKREEPCDERELALLAKPSALSSALAYFL